MISVTIPIKIISVANLREHWSMRAKRASVHRKAAWVMLMAATASAKRKKKSAVVVTLTRVGTKLLDDDNYVNGAKACRDGVADWLGMDDADPRITWRYAQVIGKPHRVEVSIQPRVIL